MRIIALFTILSLAPLNISGQSRLPFHLELTPHMSMKNSAAGGNIRQWWIEAIENAVFTLDEEPEPYFALDAAILFPHVESNLRIGIGVSFMLADTRSHWGFYQDLGLYHILNIMTKIHAIKFPIKYRLPAYKEFSIVVTPSLLSGTIYGSYDNLGSITNFKETRSTGFAIEAGFDVYYNTLLGAYIRGGTRLLSNDLIWVDNSAVILNSGDNATVGLNGFYFTIGMTMRLAI